MPVLVADTSPLVALSLVHRLDLLLEIAETIIVPTAVHREIVINGPGWIAAKDIQDALGRKPWLVVTSPAGGDFLDGLRRKLGAGEAEALALAREIGAPVLLDDGKARKVARRESISVVGTLGLLARCKLAGRIEAAAPLLVCLPGASSRAGSKRQPRLSASCKRLNTTLTTSL